MRTKFAFLALFFLAALPAIGQDDKTYTLKLKKDSVGDKVKITSEDTGNSTFSFELMGQEMKKTEKKIVKHSYTEEILAKPDGARKATKLVRQYDVSEMTKDGKKTTHVYSGKKVTIEKKGEKFVFRSDGELIEGEDAEELENEFNKKDEIPLENEDLMPAKPVKIGESWKVDVAKVVKSFESALPFSLDAEKTTVTGKLLKAYEKDGKPFASIELKLFLAVKELKVDGQEIAMKKGSNITVETILDACIDGTSHSGVEKSTMVMKMSGDIPNGKISISGDVKMTKTADDLGKK